VRIVGIVAVTLAALAAGLGCTSQSAPCTPNGPPPYNIVSPTTLTAQCSPYIAQQTIEVQSTLTIAPGVSLLFEPLGRQAQIATLHVNGVAGAGIIAQGTMALPIVLGSADPAPKAGDWGGVVIEGGGNQTNTFVYVTLKHAGGPSQETPAGMWLGGAAQITNTTFQEINAVGLNVQDVASMTPPTRLVAFSNNTFAGSVTPAPLQISGRLIPEIGAKNVFGTNYILVESSSGYPSTGTWALQDAAYEAISTIVITGGTVTLPAMVTLFMRPGTGIHIQAGGQLVMQQATLTSTAQSAQAWEGINVEQGGSVNIAGSTIEYGGKTSISGGPLGQIMLAAGCTGSVTNTTFNGGCPAGTCAAPPTCTAGCTGPTDGGCSGCCIDCSSCGGQCPTSLAAIAMDCADDPAVVPPGVARSGNTYTGHTLCSGTWEYTSTVTPANCPITMMEAECYAQ
jgi:hypothetical protein